MHAHHLQHFQKNNNCFSRRSFTATFCTDYDLRFFQNARKCTLTAIQKNAIQASVENSRTDRAGPSVTERAHDSPSGGMGSVRPIHPSASFPEQTRHICKQRNCNQFQNMPAFYSNHIYDPFPFYTIVPLKLDFAAEKGGMAVSAVWRLVYFLAPCPSEP